MRWGPRIVREGVWVALGHGSVALASVAGVRALTSLLDPAGYGHVVLLMGLGTLGSNLLCGPILQAALRYFPEARDASRIGALRGMAASFLRRAVALVALGLVVTALVRRIAGIEGGSLAAFLAVAVFVAADTWRGLESNLLNGDRRQKDYAIRTALDAWARALGGVAAAALLGPSAHHVIAGFALGSIVVGVALARRIVRGEGRPEDWRRDPWVAEHRARMLAYALPLAPQAAFAWLMGLGDRYVLAAVRDSASAGVYAAAYGLASQPFIAANFVISTTLRPVLYDAVARGDRAKEVRTLRTWLAVVAGALATGWALVTLLREPICAIFLGPAFREGASLIPWIAGGYALQGVQHSFEFMLFAHGQTRRLVVLQAGAALTSLVLYLALIPQAGARGAAIATCATFGVTTLLAFALADGPRRLGLVRDRA